MRSGGHGRTVNEDKERGEGKERGEELTAFPVRWAQHRTGNAGDTMPKAVGARASRGTGAYTSGGSAAGLGIASPGVVAAARSVRIRPPACGHPTWIVVTWPCPTPRARGTASTRRRASMP
ncbi:hypothetical protein BKD26_30565 [Streptomyces sp. CB03238]|nr:hypothetical protein BKD26_30565 [Streptomyces sp. CB03238]